MNFVQRSPMRTHSGQPVVYADPSRTTVLWEDLEAALTRQRRYAGFIDWTIAQHLALCVLVANHLGYSQRLVTLCAVHDLHEAYVLDLPRPLKECLPGYGPIEDAWEEHVHRSLGVEPPTEAEHRLVKVVDLRALALEMTVLGWEEWEPGQAVVASTGGPVSPLERGLVKRLTHTGATYHMDVVRRAILAGASTPPRGGATPGAT